VARPPWGSLYSDTLPSLDTGPCRCFYALEMALEEPAGPFSLDLRDPDWLGYAEVSLAGVQLLHCPRCGGRCGAWADDAIAAHQRFRDARGRFDFVRESDLVMVDAAARCVALGGVAEGEPDPYGTTWIVAADHLSVTIRWDNDHDRWYGYAQFWPGPALLARPFRS
jgi:hypothetical protein